MRGVLPPGFGEELGEEGGWTVHSIFALCGKVQEARSERSRGSNGCERGPAQCPGGGCRRSCPGWFSSGAGSGEVPDEVHGLGGPPASYLQTVRVLLVYINGISWCISELN